MFEEVVGLGHFLAFSNSEGTKKSSFGQPNTLKIVRNLRP